MIGIQDERCNPQVSEMIIFKETENMKITINRNGSDYHLLPHLHKITDSISTSDSRPWVIMKRKFYQHYNYCEHH